MDYYSNYSNYISFIYDIFYTFAHLKRRLNNEKNKQKCKNLIISHLEMTMKFKNLFLYKKIKELVNKHNNLLYSVPYQHFTNSIENFFSMLKSRLQKLEGLKYEELKINIDKVVREIPRDKYKNIIRGTYKRPIGFIRKPSNRTRKLKNYL